MSGFATRTKQQGMAQKKRHHRQKSIYLTDREYRSIQNHIAGSGVSFSAFCRGLLSGEKLIDKRSIPVEQYRQLSAIGNNLNQLARLANQSHQIPSGFMGLIQDLKGHLSAIQEALQ